MNELEKLWKELITWRSVFHQFDKDKSDFIDVSELKRVFQSVGEWVVIFQFFLSLT